MNQRQHFDLRCITGGPFGTNAYLIVDPRTRKCAVVDPGYDADEEWGEIIRRDGLDLESILCTHGHIDHTVGVAALLRAFPGTPVYIHKDDEFMLTGGKAYAARMFGLPEYEPAKPTHYFEEGKSVQVGGVEFGVYHVPGHSPGSVALVNGNRMISGDVIFFGSIGRTDLPGGDYGVLADSIVNKLLPLGDEVVIYSGHGPETTIGQEKMINPFIREMMAQAGISG